MDRLRDDIRSIATPTEMQRLYPKESPGIKGSQSFKNPHANSATVILWIQMTVDRVQNAGACNSSSWSIFNEQLSHLMENVEAMNKIDKTQFPLPYAQIVKLLMIVFVTLLPFQIVKDCGYFTLLVSGLVALGFYGLDEVSEILESPFGNDPNDIDLRTDCLSLMADILTFYEERTMVKKDFNAVWDPEREAWQTILQEPEIRKWNDVETKTSRTYTEFCGCVTSEGLLAEDSFTRAGYAQQANQKRDGYTQLRTAEDSFTTF